MRKELKSKSRRKWLLGGSLAFASVALLTTGFATWVIGTQKTSGDDQVHIGVDTVEDKSVELTFKLGDDNEITVAEDAEKSSNINLPIEESVTPDWDIKIKDLNIAVGQTFYDSLKAKQEEKQKAGQDLDLKIAFELQKDVAVAEDKNSVTQDIVGGRTGSSWNYIKLATNEFKVALPDTYPAGGKICDINGISNNPDGNITNLDPKGNNKTISFTWGSYFNGKAPSDFYKEKEPTEGLREYYQNALKELQAMNKALDKGTLKLTATFDYGQQKVGE